VESIKDRMASLIDERFYYKESGHLHSVFKYLQRDPGETSPGIGAGFSDCMAVDSGLSLVNWPQVPQGFTAKVPTKQWKQRRRTARMQYFGLLISPKINPIDKGLRQVFNAVGCSIA
jgi:hypothetical protein